MDERRDPEPAAGSTQHVLAGVGQLSPVQEAWAAYVAHATHCAGCRDVDRRCEQAEQLYRAWRELSSAALRRLGAERA
ncbi:hypothetical protein [Streptomyces sp. NPDC047706]|uniref:hypothetical protein n=1 Tax=Streptomyces sp. NPDC047706 TaxID=3365486 RepID=UPI00371FE9EE